MPAITVVFRKAESVPLPASFWLEASGYVISELFVVLECGVPMLPPVIVSKITFGGTSTSSVNDCRECYTSVKD